MPEMSPSEAKAQAGSRLVRQQIKTKLPGWKAQADKAKGLLSGWCEIVGLPQIAADRMFEFFDKAPEKFSFANALIAMSEDRKEVRVFGEFEKGKGYENFEHRFLVSDLTQ